MNDGKFSKRYDLEFQQNAVRLLSTSGKKVKELARELGVSTWTLRRWKELHEPSKAATPEDPAQVELRRLQRELADVREQRDILKKALAICSQDPHRRGNTN